MKKFLHSTTLIEVIVVVAVVFFFSGFVYLTTLEPNHSNHINYKYDVITDTTTWEKFRETDPEVLAVLRKEENDGLRF